MVGSIIPPHCNLLTMLGFCRTSKCKELLLVSPFRSNGSVSFRLRHRPKNQFPLDWPTRMKIATGAARGLSHLHDLNILHRDIKAANILLDEEFEPHIGDFGLAKFIDRSHGGYSVDCIKGAPVLLRKESKAGSDSGILHVTTAVRGTIGHIAPEYLSTGKCSVKTDVFAFGTMLLELVTGERALDLARRADDNHLTLLDWVEGLLLERRWGIQVDPDLQGACNEEEIEKVIQLALLCTQSDPRGRPSAAQVVRILEGQSIEKRWREYRRWQEYLNDLRPLRSNDWIVELQLFNSFFWKKSSGPDDQDYLKKHSTDFSQPCWDCRHLN
ncbi:hypothetical protein BT93_E1509 [Corymbia citriodora subsp. variegata]|nr:hypothetical protein BT93_E1509 [Corymbia citriodora subsp. variegata]